MVCNTEFGSSPVPLQTQLYTSLTLFMTRNKVTTTMTTATVRNIPPATEPLITCHGCHELIMMVTGEVPIYKGNSNSEVVLLAGSYYKQHVCIHSSYV